MINSGDGLTELKSNHTGRFMFHSGPWSISCDWSVSGMGAEMQNGPQGRAAGPCVFNNSKGRAFPVALPSVHYSVVGAIH